MKISDLAFTRIPKEPTFLCAFWLSFLLLGGCASTNAPLRPISPVERACHDWYLKLDEALAENDVVDPSTIKIKGFTYLRANRFLASFRSGKPSNDAYKAWIRQMNQLDLKLRLIETNNLPVSAARTALALAPFGENFVQSLQCCSNVLIDAALQRSAYQTLLRERIEPKDLYRSWQRFFGFYWLSQYPARFALKNLHRELAATFAKAPDSLPVEGRLIRYEPEGKASALITPSEIAAKLQESYRNPLAMPLLSDDDLAKMFDIFAPVWEIDTRNADDMIGEAAFNAQGEPFIDTNRPTVYQKHAYTRRKGRILLQLIYQIWLPAREKTGPTDLYGGDLDSVIWRVTLSTEGVPIAYDSIHACGCYYLLFPGPGQRAKLPSDGAEAVLSPKPIAIPQPGERLLLRIAGRTHYLQQVSVTPEHLGTSSTRYRTQPYDDLLSLSLADGSRRSFFGPDGIIADSYRAERFLLWPFGLPSPGAMRQWGLHAIAFTGKRYFDDPYLLENLLGDAL